MYIIHSYYIYTSYLFISRNQTPGDLLRHLEVFTSKFISSRLPGQIASWHCNSRHGVLRWNHLGEKNMWIQKQAAMNNGESWKWWFRISKKWPKWFSFFFSCQILPEFAMRWQVEERLQFSWCRPLAVRLPMVSTKLRRRPNSMINSWCKLLLVII